MRELETITELSPPTVRVRARVRVRVRVRVREGNEGAVAQPTFGSGLGLRFTLRWP